MNIVPFVSSTALDMGGSVGGHRVLPQSIQSGSFGDYLARAHLALTSSLERSEPSSSLDAPVSISAVDDEVIATEDPFPLGAILAGSEGVAHLVEPGEGLIAEDPPQLGPHGSTSSGWNGEVIPRQTKADSLSMGSSILVPGDGKGVNYSVIKRSDEPAGVSSVQSSTNKPMTPTEDVAPSGGVEVATALEESSVVGRRSSPRTPVFAGENSSSMRSHLQSSLGSSAGLQDSPPLSGVKEQVSWGDQPSDSLQNPLSSRPHSPPNWGGSTGLLESHPLDVLAGATRGRVGDPVDLHSEAIEGSGMATDRAPTTGGVSPHPETFRITLGSQTPEPIVSEQHEVDVDRPGAMPDDELEAFFQGHAMQDRPGGRRFARVGDNGGPSADEPPSQGSTPGIGSVFRPILGHAPSLRSEPVKTSEGDGMIRGSSLVKTLTGQDGAPRLEQPWPLIEGSSIERPWTSIPDVTDEEIGEPERGRNDRSAVDSQARSGGIGPMNDEVTPGAASSLSKEDVRRPADAEGSAPTRPRPIPPEAIQRMVRKVEVDVNELVSNLRLRLAPESLGALDVRLAVEDGTLSARFFAQTEHVRALIESALPDLRQQLEEQGLSVSQLDVSVGERGKQDSDGAWKRTRQTPVRTGHSFEANSSDVTEQESPSSLRVDLLV